MITAGYPNNEEDRLNALRSFQILDTAEEEEFDNITFLASVICQTPISLISLIDTDRQFFKSHFGLPVSETSRDYSFCAHAIHQPQILFEVADARLDSRFFDNPFVTGDPNIVFYAGIPLVTNDGFGLGTLCVVDTIPRSLTEQQKEALTKLAKQVKLILEARQKKLFENELKLFDYTFRNSSLPTYYINEDASFYDYNDAGCKQLGYTKEEFKTLNVFNIAIDQDVNSYSSLWQEMKETGKLNFEGQQKRKDGSLIDVNIICSYVKFGEKELNCTYVVDITEKKQQEYQMRYLDHAFRNTDTGIFFLKADGSFMDFNKATANLLGYSHEEFLNITIMDINPIVTKDFWEKRWIELKDNPHQTVNSKFKKKDGSLIDVEVKTNCIELGSEIIIYGFYSDITERLKGLEDLKNSNQRYEYATLATSDVIWEVDIIKNEIFISQNFTNIFGHPVEQGWMPIENNIWKQNIHPDQLEDVLKSQFEELERNHLKYHWEGEYQFRRSDGSYAHVFDRTIGIKDDQGKLVKMVGAIKDITQQKEEEERLKLMEAVILNANDSVLITEAEPLDGTGPKILFVNPAFERMTGYSKEEVIGKTPRILQNEETDRKELNRLSKALRNWESCEITVLNSRKNGDKFWVNFQVIPIADKKGWFTHWIALERDVTRQIESTQEKEKLVKELIESNLELKQFSYITSHNLRAPLTNLVAVCDLIKTDKIADARTVKLIDSFKITTHRLNETLNDLIEILIIKENRNLQTSQIAFKDVLKKINDSLSVSLLDNKVIVNADFSEASSITFTNAYLESIFINLFTNAIKYRHTERVPVITIKTFKESNGDTKLIFNDNGSGINMKHARDKIFGLYKKFHSNADSKGIGLYLIHSQITALGGTIEVESEVNIGTTFKLTFK